MIRIAYLIDTWAWIAYFDHDNTELKEIIDGDDVFFTSVITLTEVMIFLLRRTDMEISKKYVDEITRRSTIARVEQGTALLAGTYKKEGFPGGIADCIILATAALGGHTILTGDQHFKDLPGVRFIGENP
jgi:predicted nucleic acid-binding protein